MEINEQNLLQRFLAGDDEAYSQIYQKYIQELFSYGKGLNFNREIVKDAIQDIFYKVLCDRNLLVDVLNLKSYFFRALRNRLYNMNRQLTPLEEIEEHEMTYSVKVTILDDLIAEEDRYALEQKIESLLNTLTDRQREAICLRFIHEMEYDEIAAILNMTVPSARNLIARAMDHMRKENILLLLLFVRIGINL